MHRGRIYPIPAKAGRLDWHSAGSDLWMFLHRDDRRVIDRGAHLHFHVQQRAYAVCQATCHLLTSNDWGVHHGVSAGDKGDSGRLDEGMGDANGTPKCLSSCVVANGKEETNLRILSPDSERNITSELTCDDLSGLSWRDEQDTVQR